MVFKRRRKRTVWDHLVEGIWPRAGWGRAFEYIKHRLRRLPDTPEKIGRGLWTGVFASFTPLFGFHFVIALVLSRIIRGNYLAAIIGTFFGNPLTFLPISFSALNTGYFLLGDRPEAGMVRAMPSIISGAGQDLWHNVLAIFGPEQTDWTRLTVFYDEVFLPYLVGGLIPGIIAATVCYMLCVPLVRIYQNRRRDALREKLANLQKNRLRPADDHSPPS
ncbi:MAG: DUF2062 domain-containing protein [Rhodobacterales bacterium]|nr:DUF2062 domain-containing protein [Rhodobacterales bacterium]